ncbi:ShlB/FhaC/HecB family hemolysin secretion/activation protein [Roseateles sp. BYS78W]|uniref:ShlB/FhaC/HecB family hemolysin secretion/activation protein n=1 Tax=Pelomonas candidula TaxID=3299025 RepID=A0ABW7H6M3_9BURK
MLIGLVGGPVGAQTAPDAGQLLQQNQRNKAAVLPRPGEGATVATPPPTLQVASGATVTVKSFRFQGNTLLSDAQLQRMVTGYLDRPISFAELQEAAALVAKRYTAAGRLARVFLPAQDVTEGVVTLQVLEARYGGTQVAQSGQHVSTERALAMLEQGQQPGQALDLVALDRALLLVGDLPGVQAGASLVPGRAAGETAVVLNLQDKPTVSGAAGIDNGGTRSTGEARVNASMALNGAMGLGDLWTAQASASRGSSFVQLGASMPVGPAGTRIGLSGNALRYHLVGDFEALNARGTASAWGLDVSHPLVRLRDVNLLLQAGVDDKRFHNKANGADASVYDSQVWTVALSANEVDEHGGAGTTTGYVGAQFGRLDLNGSPSQAFDAAGPRTDGSFRKLRYQLAREQALLGEWSAFVSLQGQWANRNLDSSEKFYLGGPQGVRAYPVSEGGGASGQLVSAELRVRLGGGWRLAAFGDWGHIRTYVDDGFVGATAPSRYSLKGGGLSVDYSTPGGTSLNGVWARRIGSNPLADAQGRDLDGSLRRNRFWLLASQQF